MPKLLALLIVLTLVLSAGAQAKSSHSTLAQLAAASAASSCTKVTSTDHISYAKCSGEVTSFDGIGLDIDISIPLSATTARPTIVMLHGWGQDKTFWEASSKAGDGAGSWHWNNVWFVSQGWVAVTVTARGFGESCGTTDQDANCAKGYTHLADRRFEIRDLQTLLGKLVDAGIAKAGQLAVTGDSYGAGQSWELATSLPWRSKKGVKLQLKAAVPMYGWTDLLDSLAPNGRATALVDQSKPHNVPFGVPKMSYISGLYVAGRAATGGRYDTNATHYGTDLDEQYSRIQAGEPYDPSTDPVLAGMIASYAYRNAYTANAFLTKVHRKTVTPVPIFAVQGWTDPLFPPVQTLQMFRKLKKANTRYPIMMAFGDVGHANAQNPGWQWRRINGAAYKFLSAHVLHHLRTPQIAYSFQTECSPGATPAPVAGPWSSLANGTDALTSTDAGATASGTANPDDGAASDPVTNSGCLHEAAGTTDPGAKYYTFANAAPTHLLGLPKVALTYALTGTDAVVGLKLWDQAPDNSKTLVARGAYRLSTAAGDPASGTLTTYLFGNDWVFPAGDSIVLQVTQNDAPYLRADNEASSISWTGLTLDLPTRS